MKDNNTNNEKMQYLEFLQNVITRHNSNSFKIKELAITIFTAIIALFIAINNKKIVIASYVPIIICWILDTMFLVQERQFRDLYNDAVKKKVKTYFMSIGKYKKTIKEIVGVMFSKTIAPLYIGLLITNTLILFVCK